jgi:hypothetical protein
MLFELPKMENEVSSTDSGAKALGMQHSFPMSYKLEDALSMIQEGKCIHWLSEGDWSMHDMLIGLLMITGPAKVYLSSYAFSEYPARLIADHMSRKIITELYCLIDKRLDVRSASALSIIKNIATKLKLVHTHAKVTVIENDKMLVTVIGSANYTTNKRYECGVVLMDREAGLFHKKWMLDAFDKNK